MPVYLTPHEIDHVYALLLDERRNTTASPRNGDAAYDKFRALHTTLRSL